MNDFYLRKNGKAIIFDEEGVETSREYEDGMKTILESENRVEKIEKNIVANKKQNRKNKFLRLVLGRSIFIELFVLKVNLVLLLLNSSPSIHQDVLGLLRNSSSRLSV